MKVFDCYLVVVVNDVSGPLSGIVFFPACNFGAYLCRLQLGFLSSLWTWASLWVFFAWPLSAGIWPDWLIPSWRGWGVETQTPHQW